MSAPRSAGLAVDIAAESLRNDIFRGVLRPGVRLDEVSLGTRLDVSRNTLREAFRELAQQQLVVHEPNRGVFVRTMRVGEARDLYAARRVVECGALREAAVLLATPATGGSAEGGGPAAGFEQRVTELQAVVEAARAAAARGEWLEVSARNSQFHVAVCGLPGNATLADIGGSLMAQMRLIFLGPDDTRAVHERYIEDNAAILGLVAARQLVRAAVAMEDYLLRAEEHLAASL